MAAFWLIVCLKEIRSEPFTMCTNNNHMIKKSKDINTIAYIILKFGFDRKQTKTEVIKTEGLNIFIN